MQLSTGYKMVVQMVLNKTTKSDNNQHSQQKKLLIGELVNQWW